MSDKDKKFSLSKKKIIVIVAALLVIALAITAICVGVHKFRNPPQAKLETLQFTDMAENKEIRLVAHRGHNTLAPENSLPAFDLAGQAGYWGAECDVYRTKDGVWVISHDPKTFRLMNKSKKIESTNYEDLQKLYFKFGNNVGNYNDLKICTLEDYLQKCLQFNMKAVIELKGKKNTEHYKEITDLVSQYGVEPIYISYEKESLEAMRKLTDAKLFYLSGKITADSIKTAKSIENCGLEFNAGEEKNYEKESKPIKDAQKEGLELAAWNVNDMDTLSNLLKLKLVFFTTDVITY